MADDESSPYSLQTHEIFWKDNAPFLLEHGYQLRPRYREGWLPSWTGTGKDPLFFEDSHVSFHPKTMDALRLKDNYEVFIKRVERDRSNHTVPLLDLIIGNGEYDFIVMPVLRFFNDPPFLFVDEVLDFVQQTLEGLIFLHSVGVAHRDCSDLNIMFDATALYPQGFHPNDQGSIRNGLGSAKNSKNRTDVLPLIRYYFTDFGISSHFTDPSQPRLVTGIHCQDKEVPELSDTTPYDPFKTDIFILGNVFKTTLTDVYTNLSFLAPLADEMTKWAPKGRPSAEESLGYFRDILDQQGRVSLRWRLLEADITQSERVNRHIVSVKREIWRFIKKLFGIPAGLLLASITALSLVYGPRNIISRIRETFRPSPPP